MTDKKLSLFDDFKQNLTNLDSSSEAQQFTRRYEAAANEADAALKVKQEAEWAQRQAGRS